MRCRKAKEGKLRRSSGLRRRPSNLTSHALVLLGAAGDKLEQRWYLDSGASNHMTGSHAIFSELDETATRSVKFGDGSRVQIRGHSTILFRCQNGEHHALMDVYFIPQLCTSIIGLGQLDEHGSEVLIHEGMLRIRDREWHLLDKV